MEKLSLQPGAYLRTTKYKDKLLHKIIIVFWGEEMFKVLIIDDEITAIRTLEKYCKLYAPDFEVSATFSNGESAIEYLKENEVDVVFSDIKMPGLNGY